MSEHLRMIRQELAHAQKLLEARNKALQTEDHLRALTGARHGSAEISR